MLGKIWFIHLFYQNLLFLISSLSKNWNLGWRDSSGVKRNYCLWRRPRLSFHTFLVANNCKSSSSLSKVLFFSPPWLTNMHLLCTYLCKLKMCTIMIKLKEGSFLLTKTIYSEVIVIISSWKSVKIVLVMWV